MESAETELTPESNIEQRERMRLLITDLVKTNQELRFREAQLKETIARLEKGQRDEVPWAGMLI
jgi:cell division protein FtsB